jgi:hypothetical protein
MEEKKMGLAAPPRPRVTASQSKKRSLLVPPTRRGSIKRKVFVLLYKKMKLAAYLPFITCLATTTTSTAVTHPPLLI